MGHHVPAVLEGALVMGTSTRRAALGALLATPLASVPALAVQPSALVALCEQARGYVDWINRASAAEGWSDERIDEECDRYADAFDAVMAIRPATLEELRAKARLLSGALGDNGADHSDCINTRATMTVLREVIALCA